MATALIENKVLTIELCLCLSNDHALEVQVALPRHSSLSLIPLLHWRRLSHCSRFPPGVWVRDNWCSPLISVPLHLIIREQRIGETVAITRGMGVVVPPASPFAVEVILVTVHVFTIVPHRARHAAQRCSTETDVSRTGWCSLQVRIGLGCCVVSIHLQLNQRLTTKCRLGWKICSPRISELRVRTPGSDTLSCRWSGWVCSRLISNSNRSSLLGATMCQILQDLWSEVAYKSRSNKL